MPMFPELDSITQVSGRILPSLMALRMMLNAALSLMLPPGLNASNLANSRNWRPSITRFNLTSGVFPSVDKMPSPFILPLLRFAKHQHYSCEARHAPVELRGPRLHVCSPLSH